MNLRQYILCDRRVTHILTNCAIRRGIINIESCVKNDIIEQYLFIPVGIA